MKNLILILSLIGITTANFFGALSDVNTFVTEDFCCQNSDTEGRLAVGGSLDISNYGVGCKIRAPKSGNCIQFGSVTCSDLKSKEENEYAVVCGGSARASNVMLFTGGFAYGSDSFDKSGLTVYEDCDVKKSNCINFSHEGKKLEELSSDLASLAVTGTVQVSAWGEIVLKGNKHDHLEVFYICGSDLEKAVSLTIQDVKKGATIIINVNGKNLRVGRFGFFNFECEDILFNFFEATKLTLYDIGWQGSVLAPCADIEDPTGQMNGQVFAKSWKSSQSTCMQQNHCPFRGNSTACKPPHKKTSSREHKPTSKCSSRETKRTSSRDHTTKSHKKTSSRDHTTKSHKRTSSRDHTNKSHKRTSSRDHTTKSHKRTSSRDHTTKSSKHTKTSHDCNSRDHTKNTHERTSKHSHEKTSSTHRPTRGHTSSTHRPTRGHTSSTHRPTRGHTSSSKHSYEKTSSSRQTPEVPAPNYPPKNHKRWWLW